MPLFTAWPTTAGQMDPLQWRSAASTMPISIRPTNPTGSRCKSEKSTPLTAIPAATPMVRDSAGKANPRKNSSSPSGAAMTTVMVMGTACAAKMASSIRCLASNDETIDSGKVSRTAQVRNDTTG